MPESTYKQSFVGKFEETQSLHESDYVNMVMRLLSFVSFWHALGLFS